MPSWPISTPGEQRADDVPQLEGADPEPADQEPERQREEDRQLGIVSKRRDDVVHAVRPHRETAISQGVPTTRYTTKLNIVASAPSR